MSSHNSEDAVDVSGGESYMLLLLSSALKGGDKQVGGGGVLTLNVLKPIRPVGDAGLSVGVGDITFDLRSNCSDDELRGGLPPPPYCFLFPAEVIDLNHVFVGDLLDFVNALKSVRLTIVVSSSTSFADVDLTSSSSNGTGVVVRSIADGFVFSFRGVIFSCSSSNGELRVGDDDDT